MKRLILLSYCTATLWTMLLCCASPAQQPTQNNHFGGQRVYVQPEMSVKTNGVYIRGFPAIVEIRVKGSAIIEPASMLSAVDDMVAIFSSKEDGRKFSVKHNRVLQGQNMIAIGPHGGMVDGSFLFPRFPISTYNNGSSQLVDLSNLNNAREGTPFSQLPAGIYDLQIILHTVSDSLDESTPTESISTQIEIRLPSLAEEEYLKKATERWFNALPTAVQERTALPHMIEWSRALSQNALLTDLDTKLLSAEAKELISYHVLMSTVFMFTGNLNNLDIDSLRKLTVPEYLELEKECFLLEIRILRGEENSVKSQIEKLLLQDPGLWWRILRAQEKTSDILGFLRSEINPITN